ncbi:hypothetical protein NL108_018295 [Boleophthalmus pectinirostris]|nr:hypothetical protein NL108_018295 [Boleophthalmus pectinirostris]
MQGAGSRGGQGSRGKCTSPAIGGACIRTKHQLHFTLFVPSTQKFLVKKKKQTGKFIDSSREIPNSSSISPGDPETCTPGQTRPETQVPTETRPRPGEGPAAPEPGLAEGRSRREDIDFFFSLECSTVRH